MRTTKTIVVEKEVTTWKCDFCSFETTSNRGCCGTAPVMRCQFCGKDACRDHRNSYWENEWSDDYPSFTACADCVDKVNKCEYIARQVAGRYDIWSEVVTKIYNNFDDYSEFLEDYQPPKPHKPIDISELYESVDDDT